MAILLLELYAKVILHPPRHPTGNNLPTLLAYLSRILVQLLCCNDSYIVHYAPVRARSRTRFYMIQASRFG
ncbi:MAG: hypothetical protein BECKG1743D_GA0114223_110532 [Candidatus Kentron sp. G]|nr:MAG: hypothetical protein BECKG1743D_GA0114223_110532 [Candidatus Kentron sp. G]VFN07417.1 MAG: hypothetical protein BECKG1743E_GA0114224_112052 [Candidatus Kentron sp. G]